MRLHLALVTTACVLWASFAQADQTYPYKAHVIGEDVYVRSGPGKNYYPTDKLQTGQEVEVYRHDPGGWYAIRPPKGSFTWVSERFLEKRKDGLAEVTGDRVAARVGSRFSDIRDVIQVRLHRGELVEILEEKATADSTRWYKIAPPSGEFRWIFGKFVDADYLHSGVRKAPLKDNPLLNPRHESPSGVQAAGHEDPRLEPPEVPRQSDFASSPVAPEETRAAAARSLSPEEYERVLADLNLELSIMVAEEPTVWTFDDLAMEARSLLSQAETALERGRARVLVNKIARFEDIKNRYNTVNTVVAETERRNRRLAVLSRARAETAESREVEDRFDGKGRLTRVVSPKPGAPRYALVDDRGDVRCYVTPAPGVNLRHYVGREIGVNGVRGYMPEQRAHHVMAKHVDPLGETRIR